VRGQVIGSTDFGYTSVSGHNNNRSLIRFKSTIEEREAFNIKHVNLIDEKDTGYNLGSTFFPPFGYFLINLFSNFWFDLTNVSGEKSHETLGSGIDDINFVEGNGMNDLLSFLELTLGALDVSSLWALIVEVT